MEDISFDRSETEIFKFKKKSRYVRLFEWTWMFCEIHLACEHWNTLLNFKQSNLNRVWNMILQNQNLKNFVGL